MWINLCGTDQWYGPSVLDDESTWVELAFSSLQCVLSNYPTKLSKETVLDIQMCTTHRNNRALVESVSSIAISVVKLLPEW